VYQILIVYDIEEETHVDIDEDVLKVLLNPPNLSSWGLHDEEEEQTLHETLAYLLTWMLMFDHFTDIVSFDIPNT
jgi:hypothetical protein